MITIDIETKSDKDLKKCGVYAYTESPQFEILLLSYSVDGGEVQVIDLKNGEKIPKNIISALSDERVIKRAFNVNFERVCLSKYMGRKYLSPVSWQCTMVYSRVLGLPSSLAEVGQVLHIEQQKMDEGKSLIRYFCVPDNDGKFHFPSDAPEKWELFKEYNKRDVEAEMAIDMRLSNYPVPDFIWNEFYLDQQINDRGILIDMELAEAAICLDEQSNALLTADMKKLTEIDNPNSVYQLLEWLKEQGYKSDSLGKKEVLELIKTAKEPVRTVLEKRLQLSKSSVKKYQAMKMSACSDGRARGMFSFYGASRSGRWAGRNIQLQNLPQNHILGEILDNNGVLVEKNDAEISEFALFFEFLGDKKHIRHVLYRCSCSRPGTESSTTEESTEVKTEKLSFTATALPTGLVKAKTSENTTDAVYNNWFSQPYNPSMPKETSNVNPKDPKGD